MGYEISNCQMQYDANNKETDQNDPCCLSGNVLAVTALCYNEEMTYISIRLSFRSSICVVCISM